MQKLLKEKLKNSRKLIFAQTYEESNKNNKYKKSKKKLKKYCKPKKTV